MRELKRCRKAAVIALKDVCLLNMKWHRLLLSFVQIATTEAVIRADECTHEIEILLHQLGDPGVSFVHFAIYYLLFPFFVLNLSNNALMTSYTRNVITDVQTNVRISVIHYLLLYTGTSEPFLSFLNISFFGIKSRYSLTKLAVRLSDTL